mgnify:CR=1 FL=1
MLFGRRKKNPIILRDKGVVEWKYATCGYCSTGCAIEVGLDNNGKLPFTGSSGALKVWIELMMKEQPQSFMAVQPENVEYHWIEEVSGLLSAEGCEGARQLPFMAGTVPQEYADCADSQVDRSLDWFQKWFR